MAFLRSKLIMNVWGILSCTVVVRYGMCFIKYIERYMYDYPGIMRAHERRSLAYFKVVNFACGYKVPFINAPCMIKSFNIYYKC